MEIPFESFDTNSKNNIVSFKMNDVYVSVCSNELINTKNVVNENILIIHL